MSERSITTILSPSLSKSYPWLICLVAIAMLAILPGHAEAADKVLRKVAVADP